jgi:hypothetical protein
MLIRRAYKVQKHSLILSFAFIFCLWGIPITIWAYTLAKEVSFSNMSCILDFLLLQASAAASRGNLQRAKAIFKKAEYCLRTSILSVVIPFLLGSGLAGFEVFMIYLYNLVFLD